MKFKLPKWAFFAIVVLGFPVYNWMIRLFLPSFIGWLRFPIIVAMVVVLYKYLYNTYYPKKEYEEKEQRWKEQEEYEKTLPNYNRFEDEIVDKLADYIYHSWKESPLNEFEITADLRLAGYKRWAEKYDGEHGVGKLDRVQHEDGKISSDSKDGAIQLRRLARDFNEVYSNYKYDEERLERLRRNEARQ